MVEYRHSYYVHVLKSYIRKLKMHYILPPNQRERERDRDRDRDRERQIKRERPKRLSPSSELAS